MEGLGYVLEQFQYTLFLLIVEGLVVWRLVEDGTGDGGELLWMVFLELFTLLLDFVDLLQVLVLVFS